MLRWLAALWLLLAGIAGHAADGPVAIPHLAARVTDLTATLTPDQRGRLEASLADIEKTRGAQVAILLLPTTQPEAIEQFGIRLAEAWKVGRKGISDGVIIIVAKDDRKMRIEVGYGLEGAIPDAIAKRIVAEVMTPRFRQGDFFGGLAEASDALAKIIAGEALPLPAAPPTAARDTGGGGGGSEVDFFWLFGAAVVAPILRMMLGFAGALAAAALGGWLGYLVFGSWLAGAFTAFLIFTAAYGRSGGGGTGGGFSSSGSGGFSGGGGSFGGGGASGSW